jgi:hypothetical protein
MKRKVFFGQNDLRFFYYRYKESVYYSLSIFTLVIFACILLIVNFVIPTGEKYFSIRNEIIAQRTKIQTINENIKFISSLDKENLDSQLRIATKSLPPDQDIAGILSAISVSAINSGVTVGDFNFRLDESASASAGMNSLQNSELNTVKLTLNARGDVNKLKNFLTELNKKTPISEVIDFDIRDNLATINIKFYYKLFSEISLNEDLALTPLSNEKQKLIDELSTWQTTQDESEFLIDPIGTESATPLFD